MTHLRIKSLLKFIFIALIVSGCATYTPLPITAKSGYSQLKIKEIEIRTDVIKNSLLKDIVFDYKNGLSPDEAALLAVIANPTLQAKRNSIDIASAQLIKAGILPNPQFSYDFAKPVGGNTSGKMNAFGLGLGYDINSLILHNLKVNGAKAKVTSINLEVAWEEWQVAEAAKLHAFRLMLAKKQILIAQKLETTEKQTYEIVKEGFSLGRKTIAEFSDAENNLQKAQLILSQVQHSRDQEKLALNKAIGLSSEQPILMEKDIPMPSMKKPLSILDLTKDIEQKRLDLLALQMGYQSQESLLREAIRSQFPQISIGATSNKDTDGLKTIGAGFNIGFPIFNRNQGQIMKERATRKMLFDEYNARVFESKSNIASIVASIKIVQKEISYIDESILKTKIMTKGYHNALKNGVGNISSYYDVLVVLYKKQLRRIEIEQQLITQEIALEISSGQFDLLGSMK